MSFNSFVENLREEAKLKSKPVLSRCNAQSVFLFPCAKYNFNNMLVGFTNGYPHYYLDGENANAFCSDIPKINRILRQANDILVGIPEFSIGTFDTAFIPCYFEYEIGAGSILGRWVCTEIKPVPPTPTGKAPKYSCQVLWESVNGIKSGCFSYLPSGDIGKGRFQIVLGRGEFFLSYSLKFTGNKITHIFQNRAQEKLMIYRG